MPPPPALAATSVAPPAAGHPQRRFFTGASELGLPAVLWDRFPDDSRAIVAAAEAIHPWRATRNDAELLDPAFSGEPRRHQWLLRLAQAFLLTGDHRHAEACLAGVESWQAEQTHTDETKGGWDEQAGFRLLSWCWAFVLLQPGGADDGPRLDAMADAIWRQAHAIAHHGAQGRAAATRVLVEAVALFTAASLFPGRAESRAWREHAARVLIAECERQIHPDGVHFEQSTCFHRYAVDVYLLFLLLAARQQMEVPSAVTERVQRMLEFVLAVRMPDGTVPSVGDSDDGCLLPLASRSSADPGGRFAVAAVLFQRTDFAWAARSAAPELAWIMGREGLQAFDGLRQEPPACAPSRIFPSGGYAVMRTGWTRHAHQMIVDVGGLGCPDGSTNGHADLLAIQCSIFGEPLIVDPGTHCYGGDSRWRDFFRSTAAHSTIVVDGASQAEPAGSFGWHRRPRVRLREWHSTTDVDFLDAEHDGYATLHDPVVHRRRVIFIKPSYWILVDDLSGTGRHDVALAFQFANSRVTLGAHPWARASTPGGECLWISPFPSAPAQPSLKCGVPAPIRGWIRPESTRLSPAPMLIYSFAVALPWRIVTLLLPDRQGLSVPPAVRPIFDADGLPHGFVFERPRRTVRFDDRAVVVERE